MTVVLPHLHHLQQTLKIHRNNYRTYVAGLAVNSTIVSQNLAIILGKTGPIEIFRCHNITKMLPTVDSKHVILPSARLSSSRMSVKFLWSSQGRFSMPVQIKTTMHVVTLITFTLQTQEEMTISSDENSTQIYIHHQLTTKVI